MSHEPQQSHDSNEPNDRVLGSLDRATLDRLVRLAADDELSADEATAYAKARADRPELAKQEAAERSLRAAVDRCMCEGCECPDALRSRIVSMTSDIRVAASGNPALKIDPSTADPAEAPAVRFPTWQRFAALAASIVIIVAVSAYFRGNAPTQPISGGVAQAGEVPTGLQLASFMNKEHSRCASHPKSIEKFTEVDLQTVPEAFREILGDKFDADEMSIDGARFVAAGRCRVPGRGPSMHAVFLTTNPQGEPVEVSLYIQRCKDKRFEAGKAYAIGSESTDAASVIGWRHGGLVYYMVTTSPETTRSLASKLKAPAIAGAI